MALQGPGMAASTVSILARTDTTSGKSLWSHFTAAAKLVSDRSHRKRVLVELELVEIGMFV